ncbi:MAG: GHKL domain-containing protein [Agathobacter sp.]|nr:GHKL domain-containing protein [Agathobacter sp.]
MICEGLLLLLYLATEILNYTLGYKIVFKKKFTHNKLKWFAIIGLILLLHFIVWNIWGDESARGISLFSMLLIPLFLLQEFKWRTVFLYPFVSMGTSAIHISFTFFLAILLDIPEYEIVDGKIMVLICQCIPIVFFLIVLIWQKKLQKDKEIIQITNSQYIVLFVLVFCMFFLLSPIQIMSEYIDKKYINEIGLSASLSCILLLTVVIWQIYSNNREYRLREQKVLIEKQMELQKQYYIKLIKQDKEIRRFRHDFNAHMNVLKQYSQELSCEKMKEYLDSIVMESSVEHINTYTGNIEVDSIINSMADDIKGAGIDFRVNGCISQNTNILAHDLCSLVYNLLKNAVEACKKIEDRDKRLIFLEVGIYNDSLFLRIKNTVHEDIETNNYEIETTKTDILNHGFGTKIVKDIVKKYDGFLESSCNQKWFKVEINI